MRLEYFNLNRKTKQNKTIEMSNGVDVRGFGNKLFKYK